MYYFKVKPSRLTSSLSKNLDVKALINRILEIIKCCPFSFTTSLVSYNIVLDVVIKTYNPSWSETPEDAVEHFKETIQLNYTDIVKATEYELTKKAFINILAEHLSNSIPPIPSNLKIANISISDGGRYSWYVSEIKAWGNCEIGLFYVEQECGEHWIQMNIKPDISGASGCYFNLDER